MKHQFGMWISGHEPNICTMIEMCLDGMARNGVILPMDKFGTIKFNVAYRYSPPYIPDGISDSGFTAVKVTYEDD